MPYVLDILIIIILVFCIWRGFKKGFIASLFGILTFIIAASLTFLFYVPFSHYIAQTPVGDSVNAAVNSSVYQSVSNMMTEGAQGSRATAEQIVEDMKIPDFIRDTVFQGSDFLMRNAQKTAAEAVSASMSDMIIKIGAGLLLFIILLIGLWILRFALEMIFRLPLLHGINKITGSAAGFVNGILLSYLALTIVSFLMTLTSAAWLLETAQHSYIFTNVYKGGSIFTMFTKN